MIANPGHCGEKRTFRAHQSRGRSCDLYQAKKSLDVPLKDVASTLGGDGFEAERRVRVGAARDGWGTRVGIFFDSVRLLVCREGYNRRVRVRWNGQLFNGGSGRCEEKELAGES